MNIEEDLKQIANDAWNARALVCSNTVSTTKISYVSFDAWWDDYKKRIFGLGFFANLNNS